MTTAIRDVTFAADDGTRGKIADYDGQVVLVVDGGPADPFAGLETVRTKYREEGFVVLALPADDTETDGGRHPLFATEHDKLLIGRDGTVVARFAPDVAPDDDRLVTAIEREMFASE